MITLSYGIYLIQSGYTNTGNPTQSNTSFIICGVIDEHLNIVAIAFTHRSSKIYIINCINGIWDEWNSLVI